MKRLSLITSFLLLTLCGAHAQNAVKLCATNRNAPPIGAFYWPPDTDVQVYLVRDMFTPEQRATIFETMAIWTEAAQASGAGVRFTYAGETGGTINCQGCLTVTRGEVYKNDHEHYAFFYPLQKNKDGSLFSARIDLDFATTDPHALKGFIAHELAHGLGLWDCTTCRTGETIMNAFPSINRDNGLVAPSACDLLVVKRVYSKRRHEASQRTGAAAARRAGRTGEHRH